MRRLLTAALLAASGSAHAGGADFTVSCIGCQAAFEGVVEDLSAALEYKALGPAEAGGLSGIALYAVGSYVPTKNPDDWRKLTGSDVDAVGLAGVSVRKGLPLDLDVGAFYTAVPGASASLWGGEVRYAILAGGIAEPALAVRANYVRSAGIDAFHYQSIGADISVSKGFTFLTPYLGAGYLRATADPSGAPPAAGLHKTSNGAARVFAGCRIALGFFDVVPEYERVGSNAAYNLALGFSF